MLRIQVMGGFRVFVNDHEVSAFQWKHDLCRNLLQVLALTPYHPLHLQDIIGRLWAHSSETEAAHNLKSAVLQLRTLLGDLDPYTPYLIYTPQKTLQLAPASHLQVDAWTFWTCSHPQHPLSERQQALSSYQGELLAEENLEWVSRERWKLQQRYIDLRLELAYLHQQLGQTAPALLHFREVLKADPSVEGAHLGIVRCLIKQHNFKEAQHHLQAAEKVTQDYPLPFKQHLQALAQEIYASGGATLLSLSEHLTDHQEWVLHLWNQLQHHRLVTLMGENGSGKTTLGLELLRQYPQGLRICLQHSKTHEDVLGELELVRSDFFEYSKNEKFSGKWEGISWVVLDHCDHLHDLIRQVCQQLMQHCPHLHILVIKQHPLGLGSEKTISLLPLANPELLDLYQPSQAVQLFTQQARTIRRTFQLTLTNHTAIHQICHLLQGNWQAIILAAGRTRHHSPSDILSQLEAFEVRPLTSALQRVTAWSCKLLPEPHRRLLHLIAFFPAGAVLETLQKLTPEPKLLLEVLCELCEFQLLQITEHPELRYHLPEVIKPHLSSSPEDTHLKVRFIQHHLNFVLHHTQAFSTARTLDPALQAERRNIQAAMHLACQMGLTAETTLFYQVHHQWTLEGRHYQTKVFLQQALLSLVEPQSETTAWLHTLLGITLSYLGETTKARQNLQVALSLLPVSLDTLRLIHTTLIFLDLLQSQLDEVYQHWIRLEELQDHTVILQQWSFNTVVQLLSTHNAYLELESWLNHFQHTSFQFLDTQTFKLIQVITLLRTQQYQKGWTLLNVCKQHAQKAIYPHASLLIGYVEWCISQQKWQIAAYLSGAASTLHFHEQHLLTQFHQDNMAILRQHLQEQYMNWFQQGRQATPKEVNLCLDNFSHKTPIDLDILTTRECQILDMVTQNLTYKEIANRLVISERTVQTHVNNIFKKLKVRSRQDAVQFYAFKA